MKYSIVFLLNFLTGTNVAWDYNKHGDDWDNKCKCDIKSQDCIQSPIDLSTTATYPVRMADTD